MSDTIPAPMHGMIGLTRKGQAPHYAYATDIGGHLIVRADAVIAVWPDYEMRLNGTGTGTETYENGARIVVGGSTFVVTASVDEVLWAINRVMTTGSP